jgi:hypothetical protein
MVHDPNMDQAFADYLMAVDFNAPKKAITLRYMADDHKGSRKFRVESDVEVKGTDGRWDKILADIGIEVPNQETDGILYKAVA